MTFVIVTFLLQMQFLWKYVDDLVGKGLGLGVLSELLLYATATFVPLALPLAILLAALMTFGNLGENYELTALKASGISLMRIMKPLMVFMFIICVLAFFYSNISLPFFNWKMRALLYDIQQQRPELQIKEGAFYNGIENYSIKIGKKDNRTNLLHNIRIYDHTSNRGNDVVTIADSGYIKMTADKRNLIITLFNGQTYSEVQEQRTSAGVRNYPFRRDKFSKEIINISLEGFDFQRTDEGLFKNNYQMMNLKQLQLATDSMRNEINNDRLYLAENLTSSSIRSYTTKITPDTIKKDSLKKVEKFNTQKIFGSLKDHEKISAISLALNEARTAKSYINSEVQVRKSKIKRLKKHEIEWHKKYTLSLACLIFFFIGAPLGAIIRKGGLGMPLVISVLFFVLYYVITLSSEKFIKEAMVPTYLGMWISSIVLLPLGVFLTYKATTDAALMNVDAYTIFFNKHFTKLKKFFKRFKK